jgi:hypothetical protein
MSEEFCEVCARRYMRQLWKKQCCCNSPELMEPFICPGPPSLDFEKPKPKLTAEELEKIEKVKIRQQIQAANAVPYRRKRK